MARDHLGRNRARAAAVGSDSVFFNTSGDTNTAVGHLSMQLDETGHVNTAVGLGSLSSNVTGSLDVAVGHDALASLIGGPENVGIGQDAFFEITGGTGNIAVGSAAGDLITGAPNNTIMIGNRGAPGDADAIRIGDVQTRAHIAGIRGVTTTDADAITVLIDSKGQIAHAVRHAESITSSSNLNGPGRAAHAEPTVLDACHAGRSSSSLDTRVRARFRRAH